MPFRKLGDPLFSMGLGERFGLGNQVAKRGGFNPTLLAYDQFADTNGVLLDAHTPNTGGPWVKTTATTGVIDIQTNKASRVSGSAYYHIETGKSGIAGQPLTLSAILTTGTSACNPGIVFRNENTPTLNLFLAYLDDAGNAVKILQYINNALTIPYTGAVAIATGTPYAVEVVLEGASIKVYVDGVLKIDTTDTDHLTATKHGIGILGAAGTIDEFQVTG